MMGASAGRVIAVGLLLGLYMTVLGWLGNNLLLGGDWDRAGLLAANQVVLPYPDLAREMISLVFDFVYGICMAWLYSKTSDRSLGFSLKFAAVFWTVTVIILYVAVINSRFLPWDVAVKTTLLALAIGVPIVFVLPRVLPAYVPRAAS
jgi:hypothetical protein